jgi:hypothetical protein
VEDERWRVWTMTGGNTVRPVNPTLLDLGAEAYVRAVAPLQGGGWIGVGEIAVTQGGGPLGHSLYEGLVVTLDAQGGLVSKRRFGNPGATGLKAVAAAGGDVVVTGEVAPGQAWLMGLDGKQGARWEQRWDDRRGAAAVALAGQTVAVGGAPLDTMGPGRGWVSTVDLETGATGWTWRAAGPTEVDALVAVPGGWIAAGRAAVDGRVAPWWIGLDARGQVRWEHVESVTEPVASAVDVERGADGSVAVLGTARVSGDKRKALLWTIDPDTGAVRTRVELGPWLPTEVAPFGKGWLVAGSTGHPWPNAHGLVMLRGVELPGGFDFYLE